MNTHLSSEQISRIVIGDSAPDEKQHALGCAECSAELERLRETLSIFRHSVERWADGPRAVRRPESTRFRIRPSQWVLAGALLVILIVVPIHKNAIERQRVAEAEDSLLLEQVNAHISRIVPAPMEPLMNFMSDVPTTEVGGR